MEYLPLIVLLVLAVPLGFAVLVAASGRASHRLAPLLAQLHLGLTAALVVCGANVLIDRADTLRSEGRIGFQPLFVPGDPNVAQEAGSPPYPTTTWNLFTLAPVVAVASTSEMTPSITLGMMPTIVLPTLQTPSTTLASAPPTSGTSMSGATMMPATAKPSFPTTERALRTALPTPATTP